MDIPKTLTAVLIAATCLVGCNRGPSKSTDEGAAAPSTSTPNAAAISAVADSARVARDAQQEPPGEPESAQEAIQVMQGRLQASIVANKTKDPVPKDVEATIQFGQAQRTRFPNDADLLQSLGAMMFQSIRFLQDDPSKLMQRRLELGEVASALLEHSEISPETKATLSFLLLEEAKGHLQKEDLAASWASIQKARELGFDQSKLFYLDPAFEPIVQDDSHQAEINAWLATEIDQAIAKQEAFPLNLAIPSLRNPEQTISLDDFQDKKLILLDLWGTWCPPCRAAIPHLIEVQQQFSDSLAVVGVSFEQPIGSATLEQTQAYFEEFSKTQPIDYPCGYGDFDPRASIPNFQGFPTMLLLDPQGRVRLILSGYHPKPVLETAIRRVLASSP